MDAGTYLLDLLISFAITLIVTLVPYLITVLITRKNIKSKTAKGLTIAFSVLSFVIFCVLYFLSGEGGVSILPIVIWNTAGYFIIKPKSEISDSEKIEPNELKEENTELGNANAITSTVHESDKNAIIKEAKKKPKFKTAAIILSITTAVFMIATVALSIGLVDINSKMDELNSKVNDLETTIEQKENANNLLRDQIDNLDRKLGESYEKIRIYEGRPSANEIAESVRNGEYDFDFDSSSDQAKENDRINWEKEKNSQKPNLDVEWN